MANQTPDAKSIFGEALSLREPGDRRAYVQAACGGDEALRQEVDSLLSAYEGAGGFLACSTPLSATAALGEQPGQVIGRYKLLEQIGEGGFGIVWMAEQTEPVRRRVALKIIKWGMDTREALARFEAERQALAMMDHPNIASVFDGGATNTGRPYFVMELVRGVPITAYCDQKQISTEERLRLFVKVCQAVQHAHQKGVIHRDLKPSNILVTVKDDRPLPKVIDFGVAKATQSKLTEKTLITGFHQWIGTPAYMSPEQAGLGLDIDTRSDLYSLGVLLYELLTGVPPFDTDTLATAAMDEARRIIREVDPPAPSTRLRTLGEKLVEVAKTRRVEPGALPQMLKGDLDCIVMACLEKDRTRRYQTANDLAEDVERYLQNEPVDARPAGAFYRLQKAVRRNKLAFASAGMISVTLLLGFSVSTWLFFKERDARQRAVEAEREQRELRVKAETGERSARALQAWHQGQLAEAETLSREALDGWKAVLGQTHPQVSVAYENLAVVLRDRGKVEEAAAAYRDALRIKKQALRDSNESDNYLAQLSEALNSANFHGVEQILNQRLPQPQLQVQLRSAMRENAVTAAQRGQWMDAAAKFTRLVELQPDDPEVNHALAALLVQTRDTQGYDRHCGKILERFGATKDRLVATRLGRDCLLLECSQTNLASAIQLVIRAGEGLASPSADYQVARALAEFRRGSFAEAIALAARIPNDGASPESEAEAATLLSMANFKLARPEGARAELARAKKIIETELPKIENGFLGEHWVEWIVAHSLFREARILNEH